MTSNTAERSIRPIALNRKNALLAGSDTGAEQWATIASLIETVKLNDVGSLAYLTGALSRIADATSVTHPHSSRRGDGSVKWPNVRQTIQPGGSVWPRSCCSTTHRG